MTTKMSTLKQANPYASALFQLSLNLYRREKSINVFFGFLLEMEKITNIIEEIPELKAFLQNPLSSKEAKNKVLTKLLEDKISSHSLNFLYFLVDQKRINIFGSIVASFMKKINKFLDIRYIQVWSSIELTPKQKNRLAKMLTIYLRKGSKKAIGKTPIIFFKSYLDKEILGGFIIQTETQIIDLSIRRELGQVKNLGQ